MDAQAANILITRAALADPRSRADADKAEYWAEVLHDISLEEALAALAEFHRTRTDWLLPAHIVELVRIQRRQAARQARVQASLTRVPTPRPPALDEGQKAHLEQVFQEALAKARAARAAGAGVTVR